MEHEDAVALNGSTPGPHQLRHARAAVGPTSAPRPQDAGRVLVTGYATAPTGTSLHTMFGSVGVVFEVDVHSHRIVDAEFLVVTRLSNDFLARLCVGVDLLRDFETIVADFRRHYLAPSAPAMIVALRSAHSRYAAMAAEQTAVSSDC